MLRFADFELDEQRAELRGPAGPIKLRAKTFDMLRLLAGNAGRVVSKQELMEAVWPDVHVSEDSLFQCVRELRTALGDADRQLVKVVPGRGYLFEAKVSGEQPGAAPAARLRTIRKLRSRRSRPCPLDRDNGPDGRSVWLWLWWCWPD